MPDVCLSQLPNLKQAEEREVACRVKLIISEYAWDKYLYWQRTDKKIAKRINTLIRDIQRLPYEGIGKPESLRHALAGYWSCRINDEHRLVYKVENDAVIIAQLRYHY